MESANIVGYQEQTMKNATGYNFIVPTFKNVGGNGEKVIDLQSIKLVNAAGDGMTDWIEVWDDTGSMTDTAYFWVTKDGGAEKDGWVTEMMGTDYAEDVTVSMGAGFYLNMNTEGATVQYSGEVVQSDLISDELPTGYNIIGNATPVPVDLQKITLLNAAGDGMTDWIEVWDETGSMTDTAYFWVTKDGGAEKDGWVTEMMGTDYAEGITFAPGEGIFFNCNSSGVKVKIPAPIAL